MNRRGLAAAFALSVAIATPVPVAAQWTILKSAGAVPDTSAKRLQADFAVPDAPAFALLDVDPSQVIRPTSVRELGLAASNFLGSQQGVTLPHALAVELAPGLLIGGPGLSLARYQRHPWLYRLRISGATQRGSGASRPIAAAIGVRVTLIDEADLRTNPDYLKTATAISQKLNDLQLEARLRAGPPPAPLVMLPEDQAKVERLNKELKDSWADTKWNARVLEISFAASARARDSLGHGIRTASYAAWATYGMGFASWGQLLIGSRAGAERDTVSGAFQGRGSLSGRFYIGTNPYKVYMQGQESWARGTLPTWVVLTGGEALVHQGIWLTFSAGLLQQRPSGGTTLVTNLAVKFGSIG